jgi:hypothetical protein
MSGTYCDMITFPIVRQWLSNHISAETDMHAVVFIMWSVPRLYTGSQRAMARKLTFGTLG